MSAVIHITTSQIGQVINANQDIIAGSITHKVPKTTSNQAIPATIASIVCASFGFSSARAVILSINGVNVLVILLSIGARAPQIAS